MQVEYESSPAGGSVDPHLLEREQEDYGESSAGGRGIAEAGDESEEEEEEVAEVGEQGEPKPKRTSKQRQSLADKQPGTTIFPMSRVKRIIKADKDVEMMSNEACFMIAVATEYFIKHFMEEGYTKARLEKRKIVNYKDLAAVVARSDDFDFLKDVIPAPIPLSEALERRKQRLATDENPSLHEDAEPVPTASLMNDEDLPPLVPSTNPLFPNAIVKKPPNTHAKAAVSRPSHSEPVTVAAAAPPSTPRVLGGKNAPSTPHSLTTRGSARRSLANADVDMDALAEVRDADLGEQNQNHGGEAAISEGEGDDTMED